VFERLLVHTKGRWARTPFLLSGWQRDDIIRPLFGTVRWDVEAGRWVRRYRIAWIEMGRKNGKSELLAGIALILLCADDEEGAEVYGAATDRDQARKVFDVAARMVNLSPLLSRRLSVRPSALRIVDERTGSWYEAVAADAAGNLGHNPSGVVFDELLTQRSGDLWDALRTASGTRDQPLMVAATTAGNDPDSFAASQHAEMVRIQDDPERAPHVFTYVRNTPVDADPWDERSWFHANPALGQFLRVQDLREEALEARNDPSRENAFRQFRLCQWVQQATRFIPLPAWDACTGEIAPNPDWPALALEKQRCFGGLDLSQTTDFTALCWVFPRPGPWPVLWRFWLPEARLRSLDAHLGGKASMWARDGWITATPGNVIDYESVYEGIMADVRRFAVVDVTHDPYAGEAVRQELADRGLNELYERRQGYALSHPMHELLRLVNSRQLRHFGNPVARWHADSLEARQDPEERLKPVKPQRSRSGRRIDGMVALLMAIDGAVRRDGEDDVPLAGGF
jgi:phage terminase large subunit-like protein